MPILLILAGTALMWWVFYSITIAIALATMCGVIAAFYAGALDGPADEKVLRLFSILVLALSVVLVGVMAPHSSEDPGPRMCNRVEC